MSPKQSVHQILVLEFASIGTNLTRVDITPGSLFFPIYLFICHCPTQLLKAVKLTSMSYSRWASCYLLCTLVCWPWHSALILVSWPLSCVLPHLIPYSINSAQCHFSAVTLDLFHLKKSRLSFRRWPLIYVDIL